MMDRITVLKSTVPSRTTPFETLEELGEWGSTGAVEDTKEAGL